MRIQIWAWADQSKQTGHGLNHGWVELQVLRSKLWQHLQSYRHPARAVRRTLPRKGDTETLGEVEDEVHVAAPVLAGGVPEIPEDVRDEAPSEDEMDGASSVSGVDLSDVAEEEILEMDRFPPGGVCVGLASLSSGVEVV